MTFTVHADRTAFTGRTCDRIVEPGELELLVGTSVADLALPRHHPADRRRSVGSAPAAALLTPVDVSADPTGNGHV